MSNLGTWNLKHGGNIKAGSLNSEVLQIEVKVEAQRQVIPLGLGDVFRVPTRDEIGNPSFYIWKHGALDTVRYLCKKKQSLLRAETEAVWAVSTYENQAVPSGLMLIASTEEGRWQGAKLKNHLLRRPWKFQVNSIPWLLAESYANNLWRETSNI